MKNEPEKSIVIKPGVAILKGGPEIIPFINLFFLLIIFFMMGSSFVSISGIQVNLPSVEASGTYNVKKYIVTVDGRGKIYFNDAVMSDLNQLKGRLMNVIPASVADGGAIVIRADVNTQFGQVAKIMALANELQINVFILARQTSGAAKTFFKD